eukprot:SAG11_NODE_238_length_11818_cov_2.367693_6_plen_567_part_00
MHAHTQSARFAKSTARIAAVTVVVWRTDGQPNYFIGAADIKAGTSNLPLLQLLVTLHPGCTLLAGKSQFSRRPFKIVTSRHLAVMTYEQAKEKAEAAVLSSADIAKVRDDFQARMEPLLELQTLAKNELEAMKASDSTGGAKAANKHRNLLKVKRAYKTDLQDDVKLSAEINQIDCHIDLIQEIGDQIKFARDEAKNEYLKLVLGRHRKGRMSDEKEAGQRKAASKLFRDKLKQVQDRDRMANAEQTTRGSSCTDLVCGNEKDEMNKHSVSRGLELTTRISSETVRMLQEDWLQFITRPENPDPNRTGMPIEVPSKVPTLFTEDSFHKWVDAPENRITAKMLLDICIAFDGGSEMFQHIISGGEEGACLRRMLSTVSPQRRLNFEEIPSTEEGFWVLGADDPHPVNPLMPHRDPNLKGKRRHGVSAELLEDDEYSPLFWDGHIDELHRDAKGWFTCGAKSDDDDEDSGNDGECAIAVYSVARALSTRVRVIASATHGISSGMSSEGAHLPMTSQKVLFVRQRSVVTAQVTTEIRSLSRPGAAQSTRLPKSSRIPRQTSAQACWKSL